MRKIYRYKDLSFEAEKDSQVNFSVEFVTDGNIGQTIVNIPGPDDPEIADSGSVNIGTGKELAKEPVVVVSDIANPIPEEDTITVKYSINGRQILEHSNLKTEEERPMVILIIKFTLK